MQIFPPLGLLHVQKTAAIESFLATNGGLDWTFCCH